MNVEDLLRETLTEMAHEEPPPHPARFLTARRRTGRRGPAVVAAAATVVVLAAGTTYAVHTLSPPAPAVAPDVVPATSEVRTKLTVRPGPRLADVLRRLSADTGRPLAEFQRAAKDVKALGLPAYAKGTLEGFVRPGTYEVPAGASAREILATLVTAFRHDADRRGLVAGAARLGRTPREIVIIASLVQAESPAEGDMPKVATVIHNRLARGMSLQLDSTVLYGLNKYGTAATVQETRSRSPYNTYQRRGLPPGPIATPGDAAIRAALAPAAGPWLHFAVVDPKTGALKFFSSQKELSQAVRPEQ